MLLFSYLFLLSKRGMRTNKIKKIRKYDDKDFKKSLL